MLVKFTRCFFVTLFAALVCVCVCVARGLAIVLLILRVDGPTGRPLHLTPSPTLLFSFFLSFQVWTTLVAGAMAGAIGQSIAYPLETGDP